MKTHSTMQRLRAQAPRIRARWILMALLPAWWLAMPSVRAWAADPPAKAPNGSAKVLLQPSLLASVGAAPALCSPLSGLMQHLDAPLAWVAPWRLAPGAAAQRCPLGTRSWVARDPRLTSPLAAPARAVVLARPSSHLLKEPAAGRLNLAPAAKLKLLEADWRGHEQSGPPLPAIEARPQASVCSQCEQRGSDPAKSGEPLAAALPPQPSAVAGPLRADAPDAAPVVGIANVSTPGRLDLVTHHSLLVQSPDPLTRVSVADDAIAAVTVVSPHQVLVQGKAPGEVSMLMWDAHEGVHPYTVRVGLDPEPLRRALSALFPNDGLDVTATGDALVLSGTLPDAAAAKRALAVAAGFSSKVVNDLSVDQAPDPPQVLLQVRFAEVDRSAVSQLGVNLISTGKGLVGATSTQQFGPPVGAVAPPSSVIPPGATNVGGNGGTFGLSDLLNVFLFNRGADLGLTLKALAQKNLLQILAEPNLLAMDGKEASFLAGGEFPFPVVQGQGAINNVTIEFKPFGVNLHFTPTVLSDGTIDLKVAPEVSALDFTNGLTVSGFRVPALTTRKAETELELADGQSFVIAGLMDNRLTQTMSKIPGLGDIPVLGALFRSRDNSRSHDELMVVVTAHLVKPSAVAPAGPRMPVPFLSPTQFDGQKGK